MAATQTGLLATMVVNEARRKHEERKRKERAAIDRRAERRARFFRAQRFSADEIVYFPAAFDPGPEYDA